MLTQLPLLFALLSIPEPTLPPPPIELADVRRFGPTLEQAEVGRDFAVAVYRQMEANQVNRWGRGASPWDAWLRDQDHRVEVWEHLTVALGGHYSWECDYGEGEWVQVDSYRQLYALTQLRDAIGQAAYDAASLPTPASSSYFRPIDR